MEIWDAPDVKELAQLQVIPRWHSGLAEANIGYLFVDGMKDRGKEAAGKIKKPSPLENFLGDHDLILMVSDEHWRAFNSEQRMALIYHEFCHVAVGENDDGETTYKIVGHDLECFVSEYEIFGDWRPELSELKEKMLQSEDATSGIGTGGIEALKEQQAG